MTGDEWLARRTFSGAHVDSEALSAAKRASAVTVSVCLPALEVEDTVGPIVDAVRTHWTGAAGIVDEVVVVDSRSTDATAARAREAGARVVQDADVLPEVGPGSGKGEALWKSLHATRGDVVLWLDSDVVDFDPAFVPGMLAPLFADSGIDYVKAVYRRRLGAGDDGGRVTEVCARPLINLHYPELAVLAQPLSGEAAGRRSLLERLPFFSGYAVELGLLIDVLGAAGLGAIAQVDLGRRAHANQSTAALGAMAFAITRAVRHRAEGTPLDAPTAYRRPERGPDGRWALTSRDVRVAERPPIASVPGYRAEHPA
ncbi:MAG: glucosyl-3-phosphoglycerate synthase [Thermoleophilia bacterium]|nr:glucosyl-3-phosphoglycerate synthase [Thermoleophilia bacterium]